MNVNDVILFYQTLNLRDQQRLLAILAFEFTIVARGAYAIGEGIENPARIRAINEMQHRLLATLANHLENREDRVPEDVLLRSFAHGARTYGFEQEFEFALKTVAGRVSKPS